MDLVMQNLWRIYQTTDAAKRRAPDQLEFRRKICNCIWISYHHRFKFFVSVLSTGKTVPPIECFYSYECCNSVGVLEWFVFTGCVPFLSPYKAHQVYKVNNYKVSMQKKGLHSDNLSDVPNLCTHVFRHDAKTTSLRQTMHTEAMRSMWFESPQHAKSTMLDFTWVACNSFTNHCSICISQPLASFYG